MIFQYENSKLAATCWTSLAFHDWTHFIIDQVNAEISHYFAIKTHSFSILIYNMPSSTILEEDSLEGKYCHCPLKWLYKRNLPQPDTFKMWLPKSLAECGEHLEI